MATNQGCPMTPHADLVARLEELASKNGCLSAAYENCIEQGASQSDMCLTCAAATAAKALAALPPPANPLYEYCPSCRRLGPLFGLTAIRSEETGGRHCIACYGKTESRLLPLWTAPPTPADPPALVALVRVAAPFLVKEFDTHHCASMKCPWCDLVWPLLAYPLPAAPPVTDTPQGMDDSRCAVCGWPLDPEGKLCLRGSCSQRPLPMIAADAARAVAEYEAAGHRVEFSEALARWYEQAADAPAAPPQEDQ